MRRSRHDLPDRLSVGYVNDVEEDELHRDAPLSEDDASKFKHFNKAAKKASAKTPSC